MSRLESMIRRMQAQLSCLNAAIDMIEGRPGTVLELGLGNGRTYDHLRNFMPDREILVFDRQVNAHPDCIPDSAHLFVGDLNDTLPPLIARLAGRVVLAHADLGTAAESYPPELTALLCSSLPVLVAAGGIVLIDKPIPIAGARRIEPPEDVPADRYFMFRLDARP